MPVCEYCDKELGNNAGLATHKSKVHGDEAEKIEVSCENCGEIVVEYESQLEWSNNNFCSVDCRAEWDSENNNKRFADGINPSKREEVRQKISDSYTYERRLKQSREMMGRNNPNWSGGFKPIPMGDNWRGKRKQVLNRDNHRCIDCGITEEEYREKCGKGMSVHHKIPRRFVFYHPFMTLEEHANRLDNLVTVCHSCHMERERRHGYCHEKF